MTIIESDKRFTARSGNPVFVGISGVDPDTVVIYGVYNQRSTTWHFNKKTAMEIANEILRLVGKNPDMKSNEDYGELIPIQEFFDSEAFTDSDGTGYWVTSTHYDNKSDVFTPNSRPEWATHVMWFNK